MGCNCSKQARRNRRRRSHPPYAKRSSLPPYGAANPFTYGAEVSSSTLDSQQYDSNCGGSSNEEEMMKSTNDLHPAHQLWTKKKNKESFDDAKAKPKVKELRSPTALSLPPGDVRPEMINAWELMAGLEDISPLHYPAPATTDHHASSFSSSSLLELVSSSPELLEEEIIISDFSVDIMSSIRIVLEELPPEHPLSSCRSPEPMVTTGIVQSRIDGLQRKVEAKKFKFPSGGKKKKKKVVLYLTSIRGVRRTYEDCRTAEAILKGYGVRVDERDVSMDGGFREELDYLLGPGYGGGNRLPAVFVDGHYLGGIEEVQQFHEAGELGEILEGCEMMAEQIKKGDGGGGDGKVVAVCEVCWDVKFVVCPTCSGSSKLYEEEEQEEEEEEVVDGFRRCPDCNENGLVRCSLCC